MLSVFGNAAGGLASSFANYYFDKKNQEAQQEWNEKMMDKQNAWSLDMWNRTNAYNAPTAQKQRMEEAGLNPLYYGLDGSSANGLESAQPLGYQRASSPEFQNPVAAGIDAKVKAAQIDNLNSQTAKNNEETANAVEQRQNIIKQRDEMDSRIQENLANAKYTDAQRESVEKFNKYADDYYQSQIDLNSEGAKLKKADRERIEKLLPGELKLQELSQQDFEHKWAKWTAEINHMYAQDAVLRKEAKYYLLSLLNNGVYGTGVGAVNALVMSYIADDPDLTDSEKAAIKNAVGMSDDNDKGKSKGKSNDPRDYSQYDGSGWSSDRRYDNAIHNAHERVKQYQ